MDAIGSTLATTNLLLVFLDLVKNLVLSDVYLYLLKRFRR